MFINILNKHVRVEYFANPGDVERWTRLYGVGLNTDNSRAPYLQLADHLRAQIEAGEYTAGDKLPTVDELSTQWELATGTVQRALDALRQDGLISGIQGKGTFVRFDYQSSIDKPAGDLPEQVAHLTKELRNVKDRLTRLEQANMRPSK